MSDRFDQIISTTLRNYRDKLVDNVTRKIFLIDWLKRGGKMRIENGGEKIVVPILYAFNDTVKSYSGYEVIDLIPQEGIGNAIYDWKQTAGAVTISGAEIRKNSGEYQIINILKSKVTQLELSLANWFNNRLFMDGTGNSGKDIDGLGLFVTVDGSGTVGGINAAIYTWWKNYYVSGARSSTDFDNLMARMTTCYNTISKGVDFPDIAITTQAVFEGFESRLVKTISYNIGIVDTRTADFGFPNLKFKGCILTWDDDCPAGNMYMLNSNYLELVTHRDANFELQPFVKPDDQDAKSALILWMGNLVCSNRSKLGIIYSIS